MTESATAWHLRGQLDAARKEASELKERLQKVCSHPSECVDSTHEWNNPDPLEVEVT